MGAIRDDLPFEVATDASNFSIAAILSQGGKPVAYLSRTLSASEKNYPAVEKEAAAIMESIRKWDHFLKGRHFTITTDQKSITFIFDKNRGKIKNTKLLVWRLELSQYSFDIRYKPGVQNVAPDALSRICSSIFSSSGITELHRQLGHPGYARLYHFVRSRNLPFTSEATKEACRSCDTCSKVKPHFYKPPANELIKATKPFERLSIDFKGPVKGRHQYLFIAVDEYSRYPFAFPCNDMTTKTVIRCLNTIFCLFGFPSYIHSDRGTSFISYELKRYLNSRGIASSRSTPYHPQGNSQCERVNQTIWRTIKLILHKKSLPENAWEDYLDQALHCVRSLICLATNETPHKRLFNFPRRSMIGTSMPTWLLSPGPVLLSRFVRCKGDPLCDQVHLLDASPSYAHVRLPNGKEDTVSTSNLAPCPGQSDENDVPTSNRTDLDNSINDEDPDSSLNLYDSRETLNDDQMSDMTLPRRSVRERKPVNRYGEWGS